MPSVYTEKLRWKMTSYKQKILDCGHGGRSSVGCYGGKRLWMSRKLFTICLMNFKPGMKLKTIKRKKQRIPGEKVKFCFFYVWISRWKNRYLAILFRKIYSNILCRNFFKKWTFKVRTAERTIFLNCPENGTKNELLDLYRKNNFSQNRKTPIMLKKSSFVRREKSKFELV